MVILNFSELEYFFQSNTINFVKKIINKNQAPKLISDFFPVANFKTTYEIKPNAIPLARPDERVLLYFLLMIFAKNPNINAKARNRSIAYPMINSWEIFNQIETDKEIIRNSLNIFPMIQPFE